MIRLLPQALQLLLKLQEYLHQFQGLNNQIKYRQDGVRQLKNHYILLIQPQQHLASKRLSLGHHESLLQCV